MHGGVEAVPGGSLARDKLRCKHRRHVNYDFRLCQCPSSERNGISLWRGNNLAAPLHSLSRCIILTKATFIQEHSDLNFATWAIYCMPVSFCLILACIGILSAMWCYFPTIKLKVPETLVQAEIDKLGPINRDEMWAAAIQLLQIILWCSRKSTFPGTHGWSDDLYGTSYWSDGTVAVACAFPLFIIPSKQRPSERLISPDMIKHIPWDPLILMGAGFAIADAVKNSGTAEWLGDVIGRWAASIPTYPFLILLVFAITSMTGTVLYCDPRSLRSRLRSPTLCLTCFLRPSRNGVQFCHSCDHRPSANPSCRGREPHASECCPSCGPFCEHLVYASDGDTTQYHRVLHGADDHPRHGQYWQMDEPHVRLSSTHSCDAHKLPSCGTGEHRRRCKGGPRLGSGSIQRRLVLNALQHAP